jgi:hypothetical protein
LKKRSEKLLSVVASDEFKRVASLVPKWIKVFWFFFSKKNDFLFLGARLDSVCYLRPGA